VSAHSASPRRSWLTALVAQVEEFVFETVEGEVEPAPVPLEPQPVVAIVSAARKSGASTLARLLAAEMAARTGGAALVTSPTQPRRPAPPSRAAIRLATALTGAAEPQPLGRLCIAGARELEKVVNAARYLAPVVLDLPPDGFAAASIAVADRVAVVAGASAEPPLLDAVAMVIAGDPIRIVNRVADSSGWIGHADLLLPESKLGARAAAIGVRARGPLGSAIADLADSLELAR